MFEGPSLIERGLIGEGGLFQNLDQGYKNDLFSFTFLAYFPGLYLKTKMYNKTVAEIYLLNHGAQQSL